MRITVALLPPVQSLHEEYGGAANAYLASEAAFTERYRKWCQREGARVSEKDVADGVLGKIVGNICLALVQERGQVL